MIVNAGYRGKSGASVPKFTYTGTYNVRDDGVVELLTSGTLVFLNPAVIDVFCVGGGGAGGEYTGSGSANTIGGGGGGGGYTATQKKINVSGSYDVTIGDGAAKSTQSTYTSRQGGSTSFGTVISAQGGYSGIHNNYQSLGRSLDGARGGSGGGGGATSTSTAANGGSDGESGYTATGSGGSGQGTTTREFGEPNGKLYSGGGGGGRYMVSSSPIVSPGGSGGGGAGAWYGTSNYQAAGAGGANTGGGGGGGAKAGQFASTPGASGGSGICCFRAAK